MKDEPVTYGKLAGLLIELGFKPKVFDERRVIYRDKASDSLFELPNGPPRNRRS